MRFELSEKTLENILGNISKKLKVSTKEAKRYIDIPFDKQKKYLESKGIKFSSPNPFTPIDSTYNID
jgi:hypothetical protein